MMSKVRNSSAFDEDEPETTAVGSNQMICEDFDFVHFGILKQEMVVKVH